MKKLSRKELKNVMGGETEQTPNLDEVPGCAGQGEVCYNRMGQKLQCCTGLYCEDNRQGVMPLCQER